MLRRSQSLEENIVVSGDQMARRKHALMKRARTFKVLGPSDPGIGPDCDLTRWDSAISKDKSPRFARQTPSYLLNPESSNHWKNCNNSKADFLCRWGSNPSKTDMMSKPPLLPRKRLSFELPQAG